MSGAEDVGVSPLVAHRSDSRRQRTSTVLVEALRRSHRVTLRQGDAALERSRVMK